MSWHGASEFFAMGGYGLYVWGAYGLTAAVLAIEPLMATRRHRRAVAQASRDRDGDCDCDCIRDRDRDGGLEHGGMLQARRPAEDAPEQYP